jgi:signal transduction histidine kinase
MATGNDVLALISQFLSKSKLELGQLTYDAVDFDLGEVVRDIVEGMRPHAKERGLALKLTFDPATPVGVRADRAKIKEAIGNIIDNAIKYTKEGSVAVTVGRRNRTAMVSVSDTGVGIAPQALPHLFEKFSRADARHMNRLGTGLGLYLAKVFVEAEGGRIWAESEGDGKGSTFYLELPLASAS